MTENSNYNPARRVADAKARLNAEEDELGAKCQQAMDQMEVALAAKINGDLTAEEAHKQRETTFPVLRDTLKILIKERQEYRDRCSVLDEAPPEEFNALDPGFVNLRRLRIYDVMRDDFSIEDWLLARPEVTLLENITGKVAASKIESLEKKLKAGEVSPGETAWDQWRTAWYYLHVRCMAAGEDRSNPKMRNYIDGQILPWLDDLLRDYLREKAESISAE